MRARSLTLRANRERAASLVKSIPDAAAQARAPRNKQETITPIGSVERKQKPLSLCLKCVPEPIHYLGKHTTVAKRRRGAALFAPPN